MSQVAFSRIEAKEAVKKGFEVFEEFYGDSPAEFVLLDGVEFDEEKNVWIITIGFDLGRGKPVGLAVLDRQTAPIRERRKIFLNGDSGEFLRIA